jgi:alkylhydroperoxidase family enzyme
VERLDAVTLSSGVADDVWDAVAGPFGAEEPACLVAQAAMINAWNRIAAPTHTPPSKRD